MPLREVEDKFTKSEIVMFSWRSQEQYWQFKNRMAAGKDEDEEVTYEDADDPDDDEEVEVPVPEAEADVDIDALVKAKREINVDEIYAALDKKAARSLPQPKPKPKVKIKKTKRGRKREYDGVVPEGLPDKFYDPITGEIDLRRVTGREAYKYFAAIGIRLPIMGR